MQFHHQLVVNWHTHIQPFQGELMKPNHWLWAAVAAFFIFRSQNASASWQPWGMSPAVDATGTAEVLPNMIGESDNIDISGDIQLTSHFSNAEFTASKTAAAKGIDNSLPDNLQGNAINTLNMMETIRQYLSNTAGKDIPIFIQSGYRSPALNAAIGGAKNSDHMQAMAVDWIAPEFGTPMEIAQELAPYIDDLGIGQLINEFPGAKGWVHTSTKKPSVAVNRVITITAQGTVPGIVA